MGDAPGNGKAWRDEIALLPDGSHHARVLPCGMGQQNESDLHNTQQVAPGAGISAEDEVLAGFRRSIDNIDAALVHMLAERFRITQSVGRYKAQSDLPPADPAREKQQIERLRKLAEASNLDPEFGEKFIRFIIDEVIRHHQNARGE